MERIQKPTRLAARAENGERGIARKRGLTEEGRGGAAKAMTPGGQSQGVCEIESL